MVVEYYIYC